MIAVYIPIYNNAAWCRELTLLPGLAYFASDNGSEDGSAEILRGKGVCVISPGRNIGRVGNWEFCVRHFQQSGAEWMKWLFAGDQLLPDAAEKLNRAISEYPAARLIIGEFDEITAAGRHRGGEWFPATRLLQPAEAMRIVAERKFSFGPPTVHCIHREALADGFHFGEMPWVADITLCLNIAEKFPTLFLKETLGEFHVTQRKFFLTYQNSLAASLQEGWHHEQAAEKYKALTGDEAGYRQILRETDDRTERDIVRRAATRAESPQDMAHIAEMLPLKMLPQMLWHKLRSGIRSK